VPIFKKSEKVAAKQKKLYVLMIGGLAVVAGLVAVFSMEGAEASPVIETQPKNHFDVVSQEVKPEDVRLSHLENFSDVLGDRVQSLEKTLLQLNEEKSLIEREKSSLALETQELRSQVRHLETEIAQKMAVPAVSTPDVPVPLLEEPISPLKIWESDEQKESKHVLFEIPAGTVIKAVLVSGADCSVAIQKPTGPNMVLLRPLADGRLPKNIKVPLKGSVIIGNAIGDISSERVYIRAERMTLVERNGSFVETDVSAYVSGEDGREGMRGVVVDRSGQIITRAGFAAFLQGIEQSIQATLNNQTIEKLAQTNSDKTILNVDMLRNSAFQGGSTALNKLADYYIKRAEQLQPAIQIEAGRVVEVVFTKTVKIGEHDLKKKFERERELRARSVNHE